MDGTESTALMADGFLSDSITHMESDRDEASSATIHYCSVREVSSMVLWHLTC